MLQFCLLQAPCGSTNVDSVTPESSNGLCDQQFVAVMSIGPSLDFAAVNRFRGIFNRQVEETALAQIIIEYA
jgi:hypothetical protein